MLLVSRLFHEQLKTKIFMRKVSFGIVILLKIFYYLVITEDFS